MMKMVTKMMKKMVKKMMMKMVKKMMTKMVKKANKKKMTMRKAEMKDQKVPKAMKGMKRMKRMKEMMEMKKVQVKKMILTIRMRTKVTRKMKHNHRIVERESPDILVQAVAWDQVQGKNLNRFRYHTYQTRIPIQMM